MKRNEPTARRGKHFKIGQGQGRSTKTKLPVMKDCSVELSEVEDENGKRKIKDKNESDIEIIEKPEETLKEKQEKLKRKTSGKKIDAKIPVEKVEEKKKKGGKEQEAKKSGAVKGKKSDAVKGKKSDAVEVPASNIETEVVSDGMHLDTVVAYVKDVSDPDLPPPPPPRELTKEEIEIERLETEIGAMLETRTKIKDSEQRISVLKNILKVLGAEAAKDQAAKDQAKEVEEMKKKGDKDSEKLTQEGSGKKEERYVNPEKEQSRDEEEINNKEKERKLDEAKEDTGNKGELEKSGVVPNVSEEVTSEGGEIKEQYVNSEDVNSHKKKVTEEEEKPQEETPQEEMVVPTEEEKQKEVPTEEEKEKQKEMQTEKEKEKEKEVLTEDEKEKTSEVDSSDVKSQKKVPKDEQNTQEKTPKEEQTKVQEMDKNDVKSNEKTETNDSEIRDEKLEEKKKVSFEAEFDINEEEIKQDGVNVMVEKVIQKLSDVETGNGSGKIDEGYVNYPSTQEKEKEYLEKYSVATEEISEGEDDKKTEEITEEKEKTEKENDSEGETDKDTGNKDDEIRKNSEAELFYVENGSDFEDNLAEKWKNLTDGTRLKRLKFISYLLG